MPQTFTKTVVTVVTKPANANLIFIASFHLLKAAIFDGILHVAAGFEFSSLYFCFPHLLLYSSNWL